ncbi:MAG: hypothetical protein IKN85_08295 [Oscillospiraceae bacterium]|nr:hypothetical protein [Oscillospiraceae bacterium]MBR3535813.1 hypothetical protein [Oscillospiraceae bacterium]MBR6834612.1 hypothetical protein [Oscillospiraceae bacterium]
MATFPLNTDKHIIFCIIGFVFFMLQFFRQGYKYQIISAFAIASTLLLYVNDSPAWRYAVGIIELILIIAIFVVMSVEKKKEELKAKVEAAAKAAAENAEADTAESNNE